MRGALTPDGWLRLFFCRSAEGRLAARRPPASACASRLVRSLLPSGASLCCAQLAAHPAHPRSVCSGTHSGELLKRPPARLRSSGGRTACSALLPIRTALRLPLASRGRFAWRGPAALSSHCARLQPVRGPCPVRQAARPRPAGFASVCPSPVAPHRRKNVQIQRQPRHSWECSGAVF